MNSYTYQFFLFSQSNYHSYKYITKNAIKFYKMAADNGNIEAMFDYAYKLDNDYGNTNNKQEVIKYYKMAVDKGSSDAMFMYASIILKDVVMIEGSNFSPLSIF